jgi:intracellular multiplication protein IcmT
MQYEGTGGAHWRDSARPARFFIVDAKAALPLLLFLVHIKLWTFVGAVTLTIFFSLLSYYGFTVGVFCRIFKSTLAGPRKMAIPWWMN